MAEIPRFLRGKIGRLALAGSVTVGGYAALHGEQKASAQHSHNSPTLVTQRHPPLEIAIVPKVNLARPGGLDVASARLVTPLAKKVHKGSASVLNISDSDNGAHFGIAATGHYKVAVLTSKGVRVEHAAFNKTATTNTGATYKLEAGGKALITIASTRAGKGETLNIAFIETAKKSKPSHMTQEKTRQMTLLI